MNATLLRHILSIPGRGRRGTLLRVFAAALAVAMLTTGLYRTTPARAAAASCQDPCQTYPLLNLSGLFAASDAQTVSLQDLEQTALTNTISDHQLPSSDAAAVLTWGRDDAEAELWSLIVQAIQAPQASRTTDQQNAVDWFDAVVQREGVQAASDAGLEYVKWAGMDQSQYSNLVNQGASESALQSFLSTTPEPSDPNNPSDKSEGYCNYTAPAPDSGDWQNGTQSGYQPCFTPCTSLLGCTPPTPSYDQFVKWGDADVIYGLFDHTAVTLEEHNIADTAAFLGADIGSGIVSSGITLALTPLLTGTTFANAMLPALAVPADWAATFSSEVAFLGTAAAGAIGTIVGVVILAVTTAVLEGIQVFNNAALPRQLASLITDAPSTQYDVSTMLADSNQAEALYYLFTAATMNPQSGQAPAIPSQSSQDPIFYVQEYGSPTMVTANSITWVDGTGSTSSTDSAKLHGYWFLEQVTPNSGSPVTLQTLSVHYRDWNGNEQNASLVYDPNFGYMFEIVPDGSEMTKPFNASTCQSDGTCAEKLSIHYVGTDGKDYAAWLTGYLAPTVTVTAGPNPVEGTAQSFNASATGGLGQTVTYQWQFEQPQASGGGFTSPISGADVSYAWPTSGTYHVQLTATDSFQRTQVQTFTVTVGDVPPTLALNPTGPVSAGRASTITGTITHAGSGDTENVTVDWGDGASTTASLAAGGDFFSGTFDLISESGTVADLEAVHLYAKPGAYTVTVTVQDQSGATARATATEVVTGGPQTISFAPIPDHTYGDAPITIFATGGGSGKPVTFSASPSRVCSISSLAIGTDTNGDASYSATVALPGVGTCTITANQDGTTAPGGSFIYLPAPQVLQSFKVNPAPLTITANDKSMTYGGSVPPSFFDASYSGFVNGDTAASLSIAPQCQTSGAPNNLPVGRHPITCVGAQDPNYTFNYQPGTLTINPAPLTITANDKTTPYGQVPAFTWSGGAWVNGDSDSTLAAAPNSAPTCGASVNGAPVSATTAPGVYPGAITCQGAVDPNYTISYASGKLTIDPLLSLDEQGLPSSVPHHATLDGATVSLPDANVVEPYGSSHSYSFPATVTDGSGTVYITNDPGFNGAVSANLTDTASYQTMAQVVSAALASGGISGDQAGALTRQFAAVQADLAAGNTAQALADLHTFAGHVRAQSGKHISAATAQALLADAQLVYAGLGGTGAV